MPNFDAEQAANSDIQAVARVGHICTLFDRQTPELSAAEVAERTGMNRTTAYRYCSSMVAAGILERGSRRGTFALGGLLLELGIQALGRRRAVEIAGPYLRALSSAVRLTAVLSIRGAQHPVVARVEEDTSRPVVVTVHPGTRLDATAAQTRLFLAYDPSAGEVMTKGLPAAERAALLADVAQAREQGWSVVQNERGLFVVAAPVFDGKGLCATVAVLGFGEFDLPSLRQQVTATANRLTAELGGPR